MTPLYTVRTWDQDKQEYTPQTGLTVPSENVPIGTLRKCLKELRLMGYSCHYRREKDGCHDDNDWCVLIERTDGESPPDGSR